MEQHVRFLATATIVYGASTGLLALISLIYFEGFGGLWSWGETSGGLGLVVLGTVVFHLLVAVPMIVSGVALRKFTDWSRYAMVFLCALNLLNVPVGSVLGGYGLWVLMTPETEPLFQETRTQRYNSRSRMNH